MTALSCVVVLAAGAGLGVSAAARSFSSIGDLYALACATLTVAVVGSVWLDWRRTGDILSVIALNGLFYLLAFVAGSIFLWFNASLGVAVPVRQPFTHDALMRAEWLAAAAWIAFALGYRVGLLGLRTPVLKLSSHSQAAQARAFSLLYVVGWMARIAGIPRGLYFHGVSGENATATALSSLNQALHILGLLPLISVAYLGVRATRSSSAARPYGLGLKSWYYGALLLELAFAVPSGRRVDAVSVLLLALVVSYYGRRRLPVKATAWAAAFAMFFVFPVLHLYRISVNSQQSGYQVSNLSDGLNTYTSGGVGSTLLTGVGSTLSRFNDMLVPSTLEQRGRSYSPTGEGETIGWIFTNLVPAQLDPGKPNVNHWANELAYHLGASPIANSFDSTTVIGELYVDFGNLGAVIAMLLVGVTFRVINEWLSRRTADNAVLIALYAAFAYSLLGAQEAPLALGLGGFIRTSLLTVGLVAVVCWLVDRRAQGSAASRVAVHRTHRDRVAA